MKKTILLFLLLFASMSIWAQEEGKFRGGLDLGVALPKGGAGVMIGAELKYNLTDQLNLGFRWESAAMAKSVSGNDAEVSFNTGYLIAADYYLNNGRSAFAPFVGGGLGAYGVAALKVSGDDGAAEASMKLGGLIRTGFELAKLRFTLSYNLLPSSEFQMSNVNNTFNTVSVSNSYLSFSLGFYIGGGKWKK